MAIKVQGTTVVDDARNVLNVVDLNASGDAVFSSTGAMKLPVGTSTQRPNPVLGHIRVNSDTQEVEYYDGAEWEKIGGDVLTASSMFISSSFSI